MKIEFYEFFVARENLQTFSFFTQHKKKEFLIYKLKHKEAERLLVCSFYFSFLRLNLFCLMTLSMIFFMYFCYSFQIIDERCIFLTF